MDVAEAGSDAEIRSEVSARLSDDLGLQRLLIGVQCVDGVVELSGRVSSAGDVARAISIARGTTGVRGVIDRTTR